MPKNHHQPRPEPRRREFDTPDLRRRHDISRNPDHEEIRQALIEHDLGGNPRVRAAQDDREGFLGSREVGNTAKTREGFDTPQPRREAPISITQTEEGLAGGDH